MDTTLLSAPNAPNDNPSNQHAVHKNNRSYGHNCASWRRCCHEHFRKRIQTLTSGQCPWRISAPRCRPTPGSVRDETRAKSRQRDALKQERVYNRVNKSDDPSKKKEEPSRESDLTHQSRNAFKSTKSEFKLGLPRRLRAQVAVTHKQFSHITYSL